MRHRRPEVLSQEELEELQRLASDLRELQVRARKLAARLSRSHKSSLRAKVRSWLDCVLYDRIVPGASALGSIEKAALEGKPS